MSTVIQESPASPAATLVQDGDKSQATGSMQLVSFKLSDETYGIEITKIREIILVGEITQVPETPHYIKGLINLRSSVIPVIDLRARFSLPENVMDMIIRTIIKDMATSAGWVANVTDSGTLASTRRAASAAHSFGTDKDRSIKA